ncbi:MAG: alpha-(1-_3)-arabinofuranosyltransferase family protein [Jatrophihabitantaceae bacterium]
MRLVVISTAIALLVFSQSAGSVAADTKLDLIVDPGRFLRRALTLWDPNGAAGQLQNQAYGYLFPMGPFFLLGKLVSLEPWMVQRCWESAILIVAFLGARRLASLLGVPGFWSCACAGLVYALSPRMLTELFSISSELLPVAALPLVLIPLVRASTAGSPRSAAMRSGLALLLAGGINASATLAILPVPALWLLSRSRGPRRASLTRWWFLAVLLACLWWLIPLVVLGKYSPPFLNWIESSAVTTSQNSFIAVARGADHWQAYLGPYIWPAGWIFAVAPAAIVATALVAAAGFSGLALSRAPHRLFLVSSLLLGFVLLSVGHLASIDSPLAESMRTLLDGPLSAFRNIHKFDPLVRLPLAIGVGHLIARSIPAVSALAHRRLPPAHRWLGPFAAITALACLGAVAIGPALTNQLVQQPRGIAMAGYWPQTAEWLRQHSAAGRALVLPGAGRPEMVWGSTIDEPLQPEAESPWAIRETVPLGQAGYVRWLDQVETLIATGRPQLGLAPLLTRAGIGYLVVRADLRPTADATDVGLLLSTVLNSPGLSVVQSFGPVIRDTVASNRLINSGIANDVPAIQILAVAGGAARLSLMDADRAVLANGSSEQLPALIDAGLAPQTPVLFGSDSAPVAAADPVPVLTDGLRKREVQFGRPGQVVATMTEDESYAARRVAHDYLPDNAGELSRMRFSQVASVRASSAGSDFGAFLNRGPEHAPWYALDGDLATAWLSGSADGALGQWFEVRYTAPREDPAVTIQFARQLDDFPTSLRVQTDSGSLTVEVTPDAAPQQLRLPAGPTQRLRLTVASLASGSKGIATGLASVTIGGLEPQRSLLIPGEASPDVLSFRAAGGYRSGCVTLTTSSACVPSLARSSEEQNAISRSFTLARAGRYTVSAAVLATAGAALNRELDSGSAVTVVASSTVSSDPRQRPGAVLDGMPGTTWSASAEDRRPTLTVKLSGAAPVTGLVLHTEPDAPVSSATEIRVSAGGRSWDLQVPDGGEVRLPVAVRADTLELQILESAIRISSDEVSGEVRILPAGISELQIVGEPRSAPPSDVLIECGRGPVLNVDGRLIQTGVRASRAAVLAGAELAALPCDPGSGDGSGSGDPATFGGVLDLAAGPHVLTLSSSAETAAMGLRLTRGAGLAGSEPFAGKLELKRWGDIERTAAVSTEGRALLVVHENFNAGWQARLGGRRLAAVRVDGWEQAFLVPAGSSGTVKLSYAPDRPYKAGLVAGALAAIALLALAWRRRPAELTPAEVEPAGLLDAQPALPLTMAVSLVGLTLLAGAAGLVTGLVVLALWWRFRRRLGEGRWLPLAAGPAVLAAGVLNAAGPSVSGHPLTDLWLTQWLVLLALLAVAVSALGATAGEPR